jgi:hypothetical protein
VLPNTIRLETVAPSVRLFRPARRFLVVGERLLVAYAFSGSAHPILLVDGRVAVVGRFAARAGAIEWFGKIDGRRVRRGRHWLALQARDDAGNVSRPSPRTTVQVRMRTDQKLLHR